MSHYRSSASSTITRRSSFRTTRFSLAFALIVAACGDTATGPSGQLHNSNLSDSMLVGSTFSLLSPAGITCTDGTIKGDVGTFAAAPIGAVTLTTCPLDGTVHIGDSAAVLAYEGFLARYAATAPVADEACTYLTGTLGGVALAPGSYCFNAAAVLSGVLTLAGPSDSSWSFKIGTSGTGALTGTGFTVVMADGGSSCNVTWRVADAATLTDSPFIGTILAGAAITLTRGTFYGNAYAKAGVTVTGTKLTGC